MALPLVRILSKLAPVVVGAFDLYQRRRESREAANRLAEDPSSPEALRKRIQELETADVEQTKLISDLSQTVEALAASLEAEVQAGRERVKRLQNLVAIAFSFSALTGTAVIWLALR